MNKHSINCIQIRSSLCFFLFAPIIVLLWWTCGQVYRVTDPFRIFQLSEENSLAPSFSSRQLLSDENNLNGQTFPLSESHHHNHIRTHRRIGGFSAWQHLKEVDGLKNEDVVMAITSTSVRDGYLLRERYSSVKCTGLCLK